MSRLLKSGLIIALVFGVVWLAVIIWWQETRALPTAVDIALLLFVLPLTLLCLGWLGLRTARAARAPKAQGAAATTTATATAAAPAQRTLTARLALLGASVRTAVGADAASTRQALAEQGRPQLDPQLKDVRGFPVFGARVGTLDTNELRMQAVAADVPYEAQDDEALRATALLRAVMEDARDRAVDHVLSVRMPAGPSEKDEDWPMLHVDVMLPGAWTAAARDRAVPVAAGALRGIAAAGAAWPAARLALVTHEVSDDTTVPAHLHTIGMRTAEAQAEIQARAQAQAATPATSYRNNAGGTSQVPRFDTNAARDTGNNTGNNAGNNAGRNDLARNNGPLGPEPSPLRIVAAADSYISQGRASAWQGQRRLMTAEQPQGMVPGEAAAALLLAAVPAPGQGQYVATLAPYASRAASADARGAAADPALPGLAQTLLQEQGLAAGSLAALVSDADHRGSRPIEILQLASALAPHLDPNQDCLAAGNGCGHVGAGAALLALALAADASEALNAPVLAVLTQDPLLRGIAVVASFESYPPTNPSLPSST
ncbi:hypothetical protein [Achromobacter sp. HZ34]|uniref:hypothetical protein n=1 Tax=Achromobacter sp. HZ34 TaxID=2015170 RepID=UPI000B516ED1|nr:hypothetical protein [Achromobacter sp. HZ34]OWT69111.1 hypothetical protein CEY05_28140 [Achromobacter sp. HZ34]